MNRNNSAYSDVDNADGTATTDGDNESSEIELSEELTLEEMAACPNLCAYLSDGQLSALGSKLLEQYNWDLNSRSEMDENLQKEVEFAMQISDNKSYPFEGASNVKFPLITVAVLDWMSRGIEALYNNGRLVEAKTPSGSDKRNPTILQACRAIEKDIAYELLTLDDDWDEGMRKTVIGQGISGNSYKKIYYCPVEKRVISEAVYVDKLVVHAKTKSLATAPRISHLEEYQPNDIYGFVAEEIWREVPECSDLPDQETTVDEAINKKHGLTTPPSSPVDPHQWIEMYTYFDLDDDGYQEPIIATFRRADGFVSRVVANFHADDVQRGKAGQLVRIQPEITFVKYGFIPAPNRSFYDLGYGRLLYGINKAVNAGINQMLDTGKWGGAPSGFISQRLGSQIAGRNKFMYGEFKQVKMADIDFNKELWMYPTPQISGELLNLITFLVSYAERISGATEVRGGENPGQNTKVGTVEAMIDEGATIFKGIYRTTRVAFGREVRAIFKLKKRYFKELSRTDEQNSVASAAQYAMVPDIFPACSMQYISLRDKAKRTGDLIGLATHYPTAFNVGNMLEDIVEDISPDDVSRYVLRDYNSPMGIPQPPQQQDPKIGIEQAKLQIKQQYDASKLQLEQGRLQLDAQEAQARIEMLKTQAIATIKGMKDSDVNHQIAFLDAVVGLEKHHKDHMVDIAKIMATQSAQPQEQAAVPESEGQEGE